MERKANALLFTATFAIASLATAQQSAKPGYVLKGNLKGVSSGKVVLSSYDYDTRTSATWDSAVIGKTGFTLKGNISHPMMATLTIKPGNWSIPVFIENSAITVQADTSGSEHYDWTKYGGDKGASIKKYKITGSKSQDDYNAYENDPGINKYKPVFKDLGNKLKAEKNVDAQYKIRDRIDSVASLESALRQDWINHYADTHPSSAAGVYMFSMLYLSNSKMPVPDMEATLERFKDDAVATSYYRSLAKTLNERKALLPGRVAPDFTLLKRDSSNFTLSSLRGKYIMIDFWASWCHPCREAIPHWKEVYNKYHDKGFDILSVSDDSDWKAWFTAMDKEQMPWTQVCDEFPVKNFPARVGTLYMTHFIPFYVLLDKEGKILVYSGNEKDIDEKLAEILN